MSWHRWLLVRAESGTESRFVGYMDDFRTKEFDVTDLHYVCGRINCHKTKIDRIEGHWTYEELTRIDHGTDAY